MRRGLIFSMTRAITTIKRVDQWSPGDSVGYNSRAKTRTVEIFKDVANFQECKRIIDTSHDLA